MAHRFKKNTIIAYRIERGSAYPLYCHPECVDTDFPGEGEAIFASEIELVDGDGMYFPGEYHIEVTDRTIDNTCCGSCGQWFNNDDRLAGLEEAVKQFR